MSPAPASPGPFFLPDGYTSRSQPMYFEDDGDAADIWQPDVYSVAERLAVRLGATAVVDVGCGRAAKLVRLAGVAPLIGIDFGDNIAACRTLHPDHRWFEADLELDTGWADHAPDGALVICSDVIEHLVDPTRLLSGLRQVASRAAAVVLSSPERARTYGGSHWGPPSNPAHVREWTLEELRSLVEAHGLPVTVAGTTRSCTTRLELATSLIVSLGADDPGATAARRREGSTWAPWSGQGPAIQLVSPVFDSVEAHLAAALRQGATRIEVTDLRLLDALAGRTPAIESELLTQPALRRDASPEVTAAFNLVAAPSELSAAEVQARCHQDIATAVTGRDASTAWWPLSTAIGLRRRLADHEAELANALESIESLRGWIDQLEASKRDLLESLDEAQRASRWHHEQADYWRTAALGDPSSSS